jgi:hypothetical protein
VNQSDQASLCVSVPYGIQSVFTETDVAMFHARIMAMSDRATSYSRGSDIFDLSMMCPIRNPVSNRLADARTISTTVVCVMYLTIPAIDVISHYFSIRVRIVGSLQRISANFSPVRRPVAVPCYTFPTSGISLAIDTFAVGAKGIRSPSSARRLLPTTNTLVVAQPWRVAPPWRQQRQQQHPPW